MFKWIAVIVVVAVVVVLALAASRPDSFRVERTTRIQAPPEKVYALIEDFHLWPQWSPFEKLDPDMKRTFSGAAKGRARCTPGPATARPGKGGWRSPRSRPRRA